MKRKVVNPDPIRKKLRQAEEKILDKELSEQIKEAEKISKRRRKSKRS